MTEPRAIRERLGLSAGATVSAVVAELAANVVLVAEPAADDPIEQGWGTQEQVTAVLARVTGGSILQTGGFSGSWSMVQVQVAEAQQLVAPGVPVVVGSDASDGCDAAYRRGPGVTIERESRGRWQRLVAPEGAVATPFNLLAFGDSERIRVHDGVVEIEDLFSCLRVPATATALDRVLVRGLRVAPELVAACETPGSAAAGQRGAEICVGRAATLVELDAVMDPERVLRAHSGVEAVSMEGCSVLLNGAWGTATFDVEHAATGWYATKTSGGWPFDRIGVETAASHVELVARPAADIDPLAPGVRTRLAFDLLSDLVKLSTG